MIKGCTGFAQCEATAMALNELLTELVAYYLSTPEDQMTFPRREMRLDRIHLVTGDTIPKEIMPSKDGVLFCNGIAECSYEIREFLDKLKLAESKVGRKKSSLAGKSRSGRRSYTEPYAERPGPPLSPSHSAPTTLLPMRSVSICS